MYQEIYLNKNFNFSVDFIYNDIFFEFVDLNFIFLINSFLLNLSILHS